MKKHNFSAGPGILPAEVLQEASRATVDFNSSGLSILEISHRNPLFMAVMDEAHSLVRSLLGLDDAYQVLFLSGGASSQFFMVPMNFLGHDETACYIDTGVWAHKAIREARQFGHINVIASSRDDQYRFIPRNFGDIPAGARYLHITSNNTIYGTQYHWWPEVDLPIVCDMSSDIFSRPIPVEKFGLIYAGAQKNMGPAGTTLVIVRQDMLDRKAARHLPVMLDYHTHVSEGSMFNTPPVFPIYVSMLTLRWVRDNGGVQGMAARNQAKADLLYNAIDSLPLFRGTVVKEDRSQMNVCFVMDNAELEKQFLQITKEAGCVDLKGHRSVGGFRASIYNAMPVESVQVLTDLMRSFATRHG